MRQEIGKISYLVVKNREWEWHDCFIKGSEERQTIHLFIIICLVSFNLMFKLVSIKICKLVYLFI